MIPDIRSLWLLLALLVLAGCATTRESVDLPVLGDWETRSEVLANVRDWEFKGRIAVKAGDDGFNGKFNWTQQDDAFNATVGGPLGIGTVLIESDGQSVMLTEEDGVKTVLQDAEMELRWRYGWTIPVSSLRYWALGIPDPKVPAAATELDEMAVLRAWSRAAGLLRYRVIAREVDSKCREFCLRQTPIRACA